MIIPFTQEYRLKERDYKVSRSIDLSDLQTICLMLGPYRNLTTLTASILFLHPNCQVLNHGYRRILYDKRVDFLKYYSSETFENFCRFAVQLSTGGKRGDYGGSITKSHAFNNPYGTNDILQAHAEHIKKEKIVSLFWKESQRTANHIRKNKTDLDKIFSENEKLRFICPVRHPIDCAVSNLKTGHVRMLPGVNKKSSVQQVTTAILTEIAHAVDLHVRYPDRVFLYFEFDNKTEMLNQLAEFLCLEPDLQWINDAASTFSVKKKYDHSAEYISHYAYEVNRLFENAELRKKLLTFIQRRTS